MSYDRQPTHESHYTTHTPLDPYVLAAIAGAMQSEDWHEMTFETPLRAPTPQGDVLVPLLQALISGLFIGAASGSVAGVLGSHVGWAWWTAPAAGVTVWLVSSGVIWSRLLVDSRRLLRKVERITRQDRDGDGTIGAATRLEVKLERQDGGPQWLFQDLPIEPELFDTWARSVLQGRSLAQSTWIGKQAPFSRSEYDQLLAFMEKARLVKWSSPGSPAQGRELTRMGRAALEGYVNRDSARAHAHARNGTPV